MARHQRNITSRTRSQQSVTWPSWSTWSPGTVEVSPDISPLITEVTSAPGWSGCGHVVVIIEGVGDREAVSYDANPAQAPTLTISW